MKEYYLELARKGKADTYRNGVAIFNIGLGDYSKFPELFTVCQLWVFSSGNIQTIDYRTVRRR